MSLLLENKVAIITGAGRGLASDDAAFITGQTLAVDDGATMV